MIGISIPKTIGIGDAIQFTSIPENFFRHTGDKLVDVDSHWVFDFNPYVIRDGQKVGRTIQLWNAHCFDTPTEYNGRTVMLSNAEAHARHFTYPIVLNRPRLYAFEEFPYDARENIILHVKGRSHGRLPEKIVSHVLEKYRSKVLVMALPGEWNYPFPIPAGRHFQPKNIWDSVHMISMARMFIGPDSGPSWIAQCYPDVITKKVRLFPDVDALKNWVPLEWCRLGSYWDDRSAMIFNPSDQDAGFTWGYRRI